MNNNQDVLTNKEAILLKMKVLYLNLQTMKLTELTLALDNLARDAWDKISYLYPQSNRIDD